MSGPKSRKLSKPKAADKPVAMFHAVVIINGQYAYKACDTLKEVVSFVNEQKEDKVFADAVVQVFHGERVKVSASGGIINPRLKYQCQATNETLYSDKVTSEQSPEDGIFFPPTESDRTQSKVDDQSSAMDSLFDL